MRKEEYLIIEEWEGFNQSFPKIFFSLVNVDGLLISPDSPCVLLKNQEL